MEDTARLALIERYMNDESGFEKFLNELLQLVNHIIENPHDGVFRRIKSDVLKDMFKCEDFCEYLNYLGFVLHDDEYVLPNGESLMKLRSAQSALARKIVFCYGPDRYINSSKIHQTRKKLCNLKPVNVLATSNPFLLSIQSVFNDMLKYEDESLQETARAHIPLVTLQLKAFERMREYQKKIKTGEVKDEDLSFDMALLSELLSWFKHKFFTWVDKPVCETCSRPTKFLRKRHIMVESEKCIVEEYKCTACGRGVTFPRHNEPRTLLRTRRGRCGEYANCFAMLARALAYDTRYVFYDADHVWCEVYDYDTNSWIHLDPCEAAMNTPLMYTHGWKKRLSYVIAVSRDDVQDVTWRYTTEHKQVLARRTWCTEQELVGAVLALREARQAQVSEARRRYLARRTLCELVQLMVERKPEEYEKQGRLSGSLAWRTRRGEGGAEAGAGAGYTFVFATRGEHAVRYHTSADAYAVCRDGREVTRLAPWSAGVHHCAHMFRKVEHDWRQVYLAREEGEPVGSISWKVAVADDQPDLAFQSLSVMATTTLYENGSVEWTLKFDDHEPKVVKLGDAATQYNRRFRAVTLAASMRGGRGQLAWQHAQLFRQPADETRPALEICARAAPVGP